MNDILRIGTRDSKLAINQATAYFPKQQISESLTETFVEIGDAKLRECKIKEGEVRLVVLSTLPDTGRIYYNIPLLLLTLESILFTLLYIYLLHYFMFNSFSVNIIKLISRLFANFLAASHFA